MIKTLLLEEVSESDYGGPVVTWWGMGILISGTSDTCIYDLLWWSSDDEEQEGAASADVTEEDQAWDRMLCDWCIH